ncbi:MAG: GNAT family N-acetyltransferase [Rectinemataceae bacterium]|nr:GNAT family N-acetyltransferase [Rectinemataceae bacterium]
MKIRPATPQDFEGIWPIFQSVLEEGETYSYASETTKEEAFSIWMETSVASYVAEIDSQIVASYIIRRNRPGRGSHVATTALIVAADTRHQGIGRTMGEHCLQEAKQLGFLAMQCNFVVSSNAVSVKLWQSLGFKIIGTSPKSFRHKRLGLVDIHIMHRFL